MFELQGRQKEGKETRKRGWGKKRGFLGEMTEGRREDEERVKDRSGEMVSKRVGG